MSRLQSCRYVSSDIFSILLSVKLLDELLKTNTSKPKTTVLGSVMNLHMAYAHVFPPLYFQVIARGKKEEDVCPCYRAAGTF